MANWLKSFGTIYHGLQGRWRMGGLNPAVNDDEAVTKAQLDEAVSSVAHPPFASSVQVQFARGNSLDGPKSGLDGSLDTTEGFFGGDAYIGAVFCVSVSRGSEWGEIPIAVSVNEDSVFDVLSLPESASIAEGDMSTVIEVGFNEMNAVDDTSHTITFSIGSGEFVQDRTFTINIITP